MPQKTELAKTPGFFKPQGEWESAKGAYFGEKRKLEPGILCIRDNVFWGEWTAQSQGARDSTGASSGENETKNLRAAGKENGTRWD